MIISVVIALLFTNPFLYRSMVMAWQRPVNNIPDKPVYDAGIVLGGLSMFDKYDRGFFSCSADRFIQTANLYHRGIIKKIIISGGTGNLLQREPPEAGFLKNQFIANGIKGDDIIIETRSRNTYENAIYSKEILDSLQLKPPFVLVTSALHMPRSEAVFKKAGIQFISSPCDYRVVDTRFSLDDYVVPDVTQLHEWGYLIKEMIGLHVYRLTGKA
ncbi:MAG: hypothetical protein NVS3B15_06610 [Sediminibacterium sp.]